jgi:hypothetical protein
MVQAAPRRRKSARHSAKLKIPVGQVHTSLLYRAVKTGKLMFPDVSPMTTIDLVETSLIS